MRDRLHLERLSGEPDGDALVLLHGFMGSGADWLDLAPRISEQSGLTVWAVDLPGHGRSTRLPEAAYTFDGASAGVRDAVFEAGLGTVVLAGYSLGGRVAMATACRMPEMIRALVIESAHPGIASPEERAGRLAHDSDVARKLIEEWPAFLDSWYDQPVFKSVSDRPDLKRRWREKRSENEPRELSRVLLGCSTGAQPPLHDELAATGLPALYIAGEADRKYLEIGRALSDRVERMRFSTVEHAGHNVHAERPDAYLRALTAFLTSF